MQHHPSLSSLGSCAFLWVIKGWCATVYAIEANPETHALMALTVEANEFLKVGSPAPRPHDLHDLAGELQATPTKPITPANSANATSLGQGSAATVRSRYPICERHHVGVEGQ